MNNLLDSTARHLGCMGKWQVESSTKRCLLCSPGPSRAKAPQAGFVGPPYASLRWVQVDNFTKSALLSLQALVSSIHTLDSDVSARSCEDRMGAIFTEQLLQDRMGAVLGGFWFACKWQGEIWFSP